MEWIQLNYLNTHFCKILGSVTVIEEKISNVELEAVHTQN